MAALIGLSDSSIPLDVVRGALRTGLPFIAIASIIFAVGITSIVLSRLRSRERSLLWLGIFALIYAVRLFLQNDLVRTATGANVRVFSLSALFLTFVIPIPYAAFSREFLGPGWKRSISIWLWVEVAFAPIAVSASMLGHQWRLTDIADNILIIAGTLLVLLHVFLRDNRDAAAKSLRWPVLVCGVLVLLDNLGLKAAKIDLEPLGILILLAGLGYAASWRAVARERKLTEVEKELTTARHIQSSILPRSAPRLSTLRIATRYQPMTAVAGDFYDFIQTGDDSLTILVADVSGHGVPAALVASMLKICFSAQRDEARDPARVLTGFNSMLRDVLGGQYVTAACASVDVFARQVTYSGAGHPPSLLFRRSRGDLLQLAENGLFIGPFPHATYTNISVPFESGDKLLLYTDGIIEATAPDGEQFGRDRLMQFLLDTNNLEPADLIGRLFAKISTTAPEDDLTVVLAQMD
ncbi:MAG TPA: PP2C family protein-serine/threonine phosphatase [Bryobacteraceae bacterium]|nr:PP2C family protein-serine/threonine phosphatase [Bryobacteraceae bacterium]